MYAPAGLILKMCSRRAAANAMHSASALTATMHSTIKFESTPKVSEDALAGTEATVDGEIRSNMYRIYSVFSTNNITLTHYVSMCCRIGVGGST